MEPILPAEHRDRTPAVVKPEGGFRTTAEQEAGKRLAAVFEGSSDPIESRLDTFPKYVRRQSLTRLLALYEIFRRVLEVKGSIVECGVFRGFGLMAFAQMSAIIEPVNFTRRVYGFDTFEGFASVAAEDDSSYRTAAPGALASNSLDELHELIDIFDSNRYLGHMPKVHLVKGDATQTIPQFVRDNPHLVISLLFLDFDLYGPTKAAIEAFVPRMPKGAIIAFDELDNPIWPGETLALLETLGMNRLRIERIPFDPYIGYAVLD